MLLSFTLTKFSSPKYYKPPWFIFTKIAVAVWIKNARWRRCTAAVPCSGVHTIVFITIKLYKFIYLFAQFLYVISSWPKFCIFFCSSLLNTFSRQFIHIKILQILPPNISLGHFSHDKSALITFHSGHSYFPCWIFLSPIVTYKISLETFPKLLGEI